MAVNGAKYWIQLLNIIDVGSQSYSL